MRLIIPRFRVYPIFYPQFQKPEIGDGDIADICGSMRDHQLINWYKLGHVAINQIDPCQLDVRVLGMGQQRWTPHDAMTRWGEPIGFQGILPSSMALKILGEKPLKTNNWCFIKVKFHCKSARTFAGSPWQMVGFLLGYQESEVFFCGKDPQWSDLWLDKNHWR